MCVYITLLGTIFMLFFHTDYNRQRANREREERERREREEKEAGIANGVALTDGEE